MMEIKGVELQRLPVSGLTRVRDLVYFDGPLLTHYRNLHREHYLYYWCDRDAAAHRWMLLRVLETSILRLINRFIPLDFVIPNGCQDDFVYFVDIGAGDRLRKVVLAGINDIPAEYTPVAGTFLQDMPLSKESTYPVLIEGEWTPLQLMEFPRLFEQTYSFLYCANVLQTEELGSFPWRGGFSAMHFDRWTASHIPTEDRLSVEAVRYESPGFIRFGVNRTVAEQIVMSLEDFHSINALSAYRMLTKFIHDNNLNEIRDPNSPRWAEVDRELKEHAARLVDAFRALDIEKLSRSTQRTFEAAQIARWFYRRIRDIANLEDAGLVHFAPLEIEPGQRERS